MMAVHLKRLSATLADSRHNINSGLSIKRLVWTMSELLEKVPDVDIDASGRFKYVLIDVQDTTNNANKPIVRGYARNWHADIFDEVNDKLKELGLKKLKTKCLGGGRIEHNPDEKSLKVYGYSQGFGKADHEVSVNLLKKKYTGYNITWSDEGY